MMRHCCGLTLNAATAKLEVHINLVVLRGAGLQTWPMQCLGVCLCGRIFVTPWSPWTPVLTFHKDQGSF